MLAIEAGKTRVLLRKLYWITVSLLFLCGVLLVRTDFKVKWRKDKITDKMEIPKAIEGNHAVTCYMHIVLYCIILYYLYLWTVLNEYINVFIHLLSLYPNVFSRYGVSMYIYLGRVA